MIKRIILILCLILFPISSFSSRTMTYGFGLYTCGKYISENETIKLMYFTWAQGYLSALNFSKQTDVTKGKDWEALNLWIENYCKDHPLETYKNAVQMLIYEINNRGK